jgi:hypothetical protein
MLIRPIVVDNLMQRAVSPGDVLIGGEQINSLTTVGAGTITGAMLVSGILNRTGPTAGYTDTTDSAQNIINSILANTYIATGANTPLGVPTGTTFRLSYINSVAFAMTLAAGTGVTLGANVNVSASSVKDYLVTVTNGTPTQVYAATTTNGSAVITGLNASQTQNLSVGQAVTGTGIAANSVIVSVQPGVGVTLNNNATASGTLVALTFSPTVRIDSLGQKLL